MCYLSHYLVMSFLNEFPHIFCNFSPYSPFTSQKMYSVFLLLDISIPMKVFLSQVPCDYMCTFVSFHHLPTSLSGNSVSIWSWTSCEQIDHSDDLDLRNIYTSQGSARICIIHRYITSSVNVCKNAWGERCYVKTFHMHVTHIRTTTAMFWQYVMCVNNTLVLWIEGKEKEKYFYNLYKKLLIGGNRHLSSKI